MGNRYKQGKEESAYALERDLPHGREDKIHCGLAEAGMEPIGHLPAGEQGDGVKITS
jgi:hypothetical protein